MFILLLTMNKHINGNSVELKSIAELHEKEFLIPSYQRGYRWTRQQVVDLLNDINEFKPENGGFYCVQPLVVKRSSEEEVLKQIHEAQSLTEVRDRLQKGKWQVIDGQQRLITILLVLSCLDKKNFYSIKFETRTDSDEFLVKIASSNEVTGGNIDCHFMLKAKNAIVKWLESTKPNKNEFRKKLLENVKFIWYESVEKDPIEVFTRLNIGKISLTNSELIKALLLRESNFGTNLNLKLEIANKWNTIENSLQNDQFWYFLHNTENSQNSLRTDFIFDLICENNELQLNNIENIGTDNYKSFRYFYEYFKSHKEENCISKCWDIVDNYFRTFEEWYNDLKLYHYIGFLISSKYNVKTLINEWRKQKTKEEFLAFLIKSVKEKISKNFKKLTANPENSFDIEAILNFQYEEDGSNKTKCKDILLFHNIQTVINQNANLKNNPNYQTGLFYKFPFHLYKLESWDVEHINSNTTNPEDEEKIQQEWLINVYLSVSTKEDKENIQLFFEGNLNEEEKNKIFQQMKKQFPQKNQWSESDKNKIWNFVLLDSNTNRSYGNMIFSAKRRVIINKDKGRDIKIPWLKNGEIVFTEKRTDVSPFVPPCTKNVFMKYYSAVFGDSNYWTQEDAECYKDDIRSTLEILWGSQNE